VPTAADAWAQEMVVKVKEPKEEEFGFLRADLTLFTYLHLAAYPRWPRRWSPPARRAGVRDGAARHGALPLLAPMSEVAGRLAPQHGRPLPRAPQRRARRADGRRAGRAPAKVVVLGAGNVGWNAAWIAAGMEAEVVLIDKNLDRLRWVDQIHRGRIMTLASNRGAIERSVADADLLIGAVLVAGGRAPVVVDEAMVQGDEGAGGDRRRRRRPGRLHRDDPRDDARRPDLRGARVIHYAVGNMPGAVPHTSTYALTNATLPYLQDVAGPRPAAAARRDPAIALGVNTVAGVVTNEPVAEFLGVDYVDRWRASPRRLPPAA
jgi:alanine dehydrogenase